MVLALSAAMQDALESDAVGARNLVEFYIDSGNAYYWDDFGTLAFDPGDGSRDYLGTGFLGEIDQVTQTKSLTAQGVTFAMSGLDQTAGSTAGDLLSALDDETFHGREVIHRLLLLDLSDYGFTVIGAFQVYRGFIDQVFLSDDPQGNGSEIRVQAESSAKELARVEPLFRTQADQTLLFPGVTDTFFSFVTQSVLQSPNWGSRQQGIGSGGGLGGGGRSNNPEVTRYNE